MKDSRWRRTAELESYVYFVLTLLLILGVLIWNYRPFSAYPLSSHKETFLDPSETYIEDPEVRKVTTVPSGVQSTLSLKLAPVPTDYNFRISETLVKSSFNSVWEGTKCSISMLTYVLSRGYRFIDLEIFMQSENDEGARPLVVGYGGNLRENRSKLLHPEVLSFTEVLKFAMSNAFSNSVCKNASDPLFIHFRVQIDEKDGGSAGHHLNLHLQRIIPESRRITPKELANAPVHALRNKVALLFDQKTCPWIAKHSSVQQIATAFTGTDAFPLLKFGTVQGEKQQEEEQKSVEGSGNIQTSSAAKTNIVGVVAIPSRDPFHFIDSLFSKPGETGTSFTLRSLREFPSINFMAMPIYMNNNDLRDYEIFFNEQKTAFASKQAAVAQVEKLLGEV